MYTIGEFSAITGITKKTLRYYDEIDLLKPSNKNTQNSYRMYDEEKIATAKKLLVFKDFGLSLAEIKHLIKDDQSLKLDSVLQQRIVDIQKEISELKEQEKYIRKFRKTQNDFCKQEKKFEIYESEFEGGSILFLEFIDETDSYHKIISEFYDYASKSGCKLTSRHYFKKSIKDNEENMRIFAFTDCKDEKLNIETMCSQKALAIDTHSFEDKINAYKQLINYAKSNSIEVDEFIERYKLSKGKLCVTVCGLISSY